ncbi:hypothetical protein C8J95_1129 [Elizabethkingia sp. YR214]|uniref:hypothetical protein n=1 Tax=Elizabethkingia sp. YR214 TaxID=2135667 RepID=UPI000D302F6D|nr:hypothetical protein [Elizabethkingia sp. YR214]PUB25846.1 hypothetical protein C8J95_1129 [Elizabethkingia sp. YR214]
MESFHYPFILGENYEKWEFDLEVLDKERIKGCDSYIYLKPIFISNIKVNKVELVFSLDILIGVYYIFHKQSFIEILRNKEVIKDYNIDGKKHMLYYQILM